MVKFSPDGWPIVSVEKREVEGENITVYVCEKGEEWGETEIVTDKACPKCGKRLIDCRTKAHR